MIDQAPILITGIPRSGTSIIAAIVKQSGAFAGNIIRQSMYENGAIWLNIVKPYFERSGADPRGQFPLPKTKELVIPTNWKERVEKLMIGEGYNEKGGGVWMYKGTGMSLIWPVWHYAFPDAKWIIVRRKTPDIIHSCLKTAYMRAYSDEKGWLDWIHQYEKRFVEMIEAGLNCKQIWPERMVTGNYYQIQEMLEWCGLKWNDDIINFVNPLLWNSIQKERRIA